MRESAMLSLVIFLIAYLIINLAISQQVPISEGQNQWNPISKKDEMYMDPITNIYWTTYTKDLEVGELPTKIPIPSNNSFEFTWKSDENMKIVREINLSIGENNYHPLKGDKNKWHAEGPFPISDSDKLKLIFHYHIKGKLWIAFPPGSPSTHAELRLFLPQYMCRDKEFCLYIWVESSKNISRARIKIDKPGCFEEISHSGTGIFENIDATGDEYISSAQKDVKAGGLTIYYSILPNAVNNKIYFFNITESNFQTSSGEKIDSKPVSGNLTINEFVDPSYISSFRTNGYNPLLWAGSECRNCYEDMADHMYQCA